MRPIVLLFLGRLLVEAPHSALARSLIFVWQLEILAPLIGLDLDNLFIAPDADGSSSLIDKRFHDLHI